MKKVELLLPAGDMEKLKYALEYGADAVYVGGKDYSLRVRASNFTLDELESAVKYTHEKGKKIYVTVNAFMRNSDFDNLSTYLKKLQDIKVDAVIVSDPGVIYLIKKEIPDLKIHLSTQANTTNYMSSLYWAEQNIKRIILARELNLNEIKDVVEKNKKTEFEMFVHGGMCISYSGRCFLSAYMINRDANKGDCAHSCRWRYAILEEEKRKGEYLYYEEDKTGAYIFNSRDMCMLEHIPEVINTGVSSLKIEGRVKTLYYVVNIARIYRAALNLYYSEEDFKSCIKKWAHELEFLNSRGYTTGFYLGTPENKDYKYEGDIVKRHYFYGQVLEVVDAKTLKVLIKNKLLIGDLIDIITPQVSAGNKTIIDKIYFENQEIDEAKSDQVVTLILNQEIKANKYSLIRK